MNKNLKTLTMIREGITQIEEIAREISASPQYWLLTGTGAMRQTVFMTHVSQSLENKQKAIEIYNRLYFKPNYLYGLNTDKDINDMTVLGFRTAQHLASYLVCLTEQLTSKYPYNRDYNIKGDTNDLHIYTDILPDYFQMILVGLAQLQEYLGDFPLKLCDNIEFYRVQKSTIYFHIALVIHQFKTFLINYTLYNSTTRDYVNTIGKYVIWNTLYTLNNALEAPRIDATLYAHYKDFDFKLPTPLQR